MSRRGLECSKSQIVFEDKVKVLIQSLIKLCLKMIEEELLGKVMCVWRRLSEVMLTLIRGRFLLWILRALDFAKCVKRLW